MRFIAGNYNGSSTMAVQVSNSDANLANPHANYADFKFNTDYTYFRRISNASFTHTFPAHSPVSYIANDKKSSSTVYVVYKHESSYSVNLGFSLLSGYLYVITDNNDVMLSAAYPAQQNGDAIRTFNCYPSGNNLIINSVALTHVSGLPSLSITIKVHVFQIVSTAGSDPGVLFRAATNRVTFGEGKFDTNEPYLYKNPTNTDFAFTLTKDKTMLTGQYVWVGDGGASGGGVTAYAAGFSFNYPGYQYQFGGVALAPTPTFHTIGAE